MFAAGVGHDRGTSTMRTSILKEEMIIIYRFRLNKKPHFSINDSERGMLPILSIIELEKGIETSNFKRGLDD